VSATMRTVAAMDSPDVVDPADAALNELLAYMVDYTHDEERYQRILDLMLTVPPIAEWRPEAIDQWRMTCDYIRNLRRQLQQRELEQMYDASGNDETL
jgi:hypothetical protein